MPREQLLGLANDVDRLLAAGAATAAGHDGLSRRARTLRELGQKVAALQPVADAVERVTASSSREIGRAFLDLVMMARQLRGSLAGAGSDGALQDVEKSGPWQTPTLARDVYAAHESLTGDASASALHDVAERQVTGDLRLLPSALAALESGNTHLADLVADKVLPAVGRGVLPDLLAKLNLQGKSADARRLRAVCKIDPKLGAELVRKGLSEGSPALKIQSLECLPDVGRPGEAEKAGLELCREKKKDVRVAALRALRKATSDEALEALIQTLLESDWQIVQPAQEVLAELPHPKTTERLLHEVEERVATLPPPIAKPKKGAKKEVVKTAKKAEAARDKAIEDLIFILQALGGRKDASSPRVLKVLLTLAHYTEENVRLEVVGLLAKLGPDVKEVVPALLEAVSDASEDVRETAIDALAEFPPEKREAAIPTLIDLAGNAKGKENILYQIVGMLPKHMDRFGDKILDLLGQLLKAKNNYVASEAANALGEIGLPARKFLPQILEHVKMADSEADFEPIFVNIEPEGTTSIPALMKLLSERKSRTRANALQGLEGYGPRAKAAESLVTKLLKDRDWWVKYKAQSALAAIRNEK
ncbi:MAG TPA: HEAT repeat domain-containing protein [Gemmataceae bacterium]|nr:HEAT repeat domain-containing protein [Gemmataceae bacterium]